MTTINRCRNIFAMLLTPCRRWILASRPKTLTGAAAPVLVGLAYAWHDMSMYEGGHDHFVWTAAVLCLLFALLMQIDSNLVNDYFDYVNGVDDAEERLGPARACASGWVTPVEMQRAIALVSCLAVAVGLPLIAWGGLEMIAIGALCLLFCFLYSTWGAHHGLGDVMVILFFGLVPVVTTYYIQLHTVSTEIILAAIAQGLVTDCLLLVNNYRDIDGDRRTGKKTLVVYIGTKKTEWLFLALGMVAVALTLPTARFAPLYLVLHILTWDKMRKTTGRELNKTLGATARNIFIFAILISLGNII